MADFRNVLGEKRVRIAAIVVAAGRGTRAVGVGEAPKQYYPLAGIPVLRRTIVGLARFSRLTAIQVVIHPDDVAQYGAAVDDLAAPLLPPVPGGASRQASVLAGLEALHAHAPDAVLIHDAARPFVDPDLIARVIDALVEHDGAIPALEVADTLKRAGHGGLIAATVPRDGLWRAQTPQGFRYLPILEAHRTATSAGANGLTDDSAVAERAGLGVALVRGSTHNVKLTTREDIIAAERELSRSSYPDVRTGTGFDVHRFAEGDGVWLGGVRIPHTHRLEGHSDADVALHALTDAVLGAIGDGDIGQHFPPSDPKWKGAASRIFLEDAGRRVRERGGRITNVDLTILCEAPRIGPHRAAMQAAIAAMLAIAPDRIGIKATTTEGLGFTGRREGIAAMATATVVLPGEPERPD
ncbi:MAG: bifunctional 2-C-methyl-D-erythritol 4-phosphate cytidylyltransferase/2-C-methyl-D-erythritol 2,4-cyclodiphosphate synthase [Hyphomicrobiaceae bacterium]